MRLLASTQTKTPTNVIKQPITILNFLIPDLHLVNWIKNDPVMLNTLYKGRQLKFFNQLLSELILQQADYYQYLQITTCIKSSPHLQSTIPLSVKAYLNPSMQEKNSISLIYSLLGEKRVFTKSPPLCKWEKYLQNQFTPPTVEISIHLHI